VQAGDEIIDAKQRPPSLPHEAVDIADQIRSEDWMRRQEVKVIGCEHVEVGAARGGDVHRVGNRLVPRRGRRGEVRAGRADEDEERFVRLRGLLDEGHAPIAVLRVRVVRGLLPRALVRVLIGRAEERRAAAAGLEWHGAVGRVLRWVARQRLHRGV
jgi:hypothetical protein